MTKIQPKHHLTHCNTPTLKLQNTLVDLFHFIIQIKTINDAKNVLVDDISF